MTQILSQSGFFAVALTVTAFCIGAACQRKWEIAILNPILIGAALIAIGTLISALTENQLSAAVITIGVIAAMVLLNIFNQLTDASGQPLIGNYAIRFVIDWISIMSRYTMFTNGLFDYSALLYYVSLAFVFLFLTVRVYEKRRWG